MKYIYNYSIILLILFLVFNTLVFSVTEIQADNPYIQYYGRWDFSDPLAPTHSWPGVYIYTEFEGTSIGIKTDDNACWYNIFIDNAFVKVFQGNKTGVNSYTLATGLADGRHTILITLKGETSWTKFAFNGFILDDGKNLLPPQDEPLRKIEFIGDSFTSASGNEWTGTDTAPDASYDNIYEGFGPITARHYNAQYHMTSRSGIGLVIDWQASYSNNLPDYFDRTLFYTPLPKWDFEQWIPNLVVVCLGLNDYSGFGGWSGTISESNSALYRSKYHDFLSTIRDVYQGVKILAVGANGVEWILNNVKQVVEEENSQGRNDVFYTYFPDYPGGYVNNGHPTVATHYKIAECLISKIDSINAWQPYIDTTPPKIVKLPGSPFTVYDTSYVLNIQTDSYSTVKYSTEDKPYDQMEYQFTNTGKREHSTTLSVKHNQQYTFYLRAMDVKGNKMDTSAVISFNVDTTKILSEWTSLAYDDSKWNSGPAVLGSDDNSGIKTKIASGITTYFRHKITIENASTLTGLGLLVKGHDAVVAYLNGTEVGKINFLEGAEIDYNTLAISSYTMSKMFVINAANGLDKLNNGDNIIAIEMHSSNSTTPTIQFDSQLFDNNNKIIYPLGTEWYYYDEGAAPSTQISDKLTGVITENNNLLPEKTELLNNYPNPFNPSTTISYQLSENGKVTLKIFNTLGQEIETLVNEFQNAGFHSTLFTLSSSLPSGIYFYQLSAGNFTEVKKMMLLK